MNKFTLAIFPLFFSSGLIISSSQAANIQSTAVYQELSQSLRTFDLPVVAPSAFGVELQNARAQITKYRNDFIQDVVKMGLASHEEIISKIEKIEPMDYLSKDTGWTFKDWSRFDYFSGLWTRTLSNYDRVKGVSIVNGFEFQLAEGKVNIYPAVSLDGAKNMVRMSQEPMAFVSAENTTPDLIEALKQNSEIAARLGRSIDPNLKYIPSGATSVFVYYDYGLSWDEADLACALNQACRSLPAREI